MNRVRKSVSVVQCHTGLLPNDLDGISEMALRFPSMCRVMRRQDLLAFMQSASAWTKCSAITDLQDASLVTHDATVGELSLKRGTRFSCRESQTPSITSHRRSIPAISRSELVMLPVGFANDFMSALISGGHSQRNTVGTHVESSPTTTPPTPWLEASTMPTKSGHPETSSLHRVGSFVDSRNSVRQPRSAANTRSCLLIHTTWGFVASILLHGDKSPTPDGIAVKACCSFAIIVSNCL